MFERILAAIEDYPWLVGLVYTALSLFWMLARYAPDLKFAPLAVLSGPPAWLVYWPRYWEFYAVGTVLWVLVTIATCSAVSKTGRVFGAIFASSLWLLWGFCSLAGAM